MNDGIRAAMRAIEVNGTHFGEATSGLPPEDVEAVKAWYVTAPGLPNLVARAARQPLPSGNLCKCGGMLVRTGSCETCQSCATSSGGCG